MCDASIGTRLETLLLTQNKKLHAAVNDLKKQLSFAQCCSFFMALTVVGFFFFLRLFGFGLGLVGFVNVHHTFVNKCCKREWSICLC